MNNITTTEAPPQPRTLREIVDAMLAAIEAADGEVTAAVDTIELRLEDKVEAYGVVLEEKKAEKAKLQALCEAYYNKEQVIDNQITALKFRLEEELKRAGIDKLKTATCSVWFQESKSVLIEDESGFVAMAEDRFVTVKTYANKTAIKDALDAGEQVEGVRIATRRGLRIR